MGIILPKKFVEERKIRKGDQLAIEVYKVVDLSKIFGTLKLDKSAQEIKDEVRKEWSRERHFS